MRVRIDLKNNNQVVGDLESISIDRDTSWAHLKNATSIYRYEYERKNLPETMVNLDGANMKAEDSISRAHFFVLAPAGTVR